MADSWIVDNPVIFAVVTYGLTVIIALMTAGIIWLIGWAVRTRGARPKSE